MDAREMHSKLCREIDSFVAELLPNGKRVGTEWRCGGLDGGAGKSMAVELSGSKQGCWKDRATGEGSNSLVGLYAEVRCGGNFRTACEELEERLGVERPGISKAIRRSRPPLPWAQIMPLDPGGEWELWHASRGISRGTLDAFGVMQRCDGRAAAWCRYDGARLAGIKYRTVEKSAMWQEKGSEAFLFGSWTIPEGCEVLVVAEGECDAMTWHEMGFPAVSVPQGAGNHQWIELEWHWLEKFDEILLAYDSDEEGEEGAEKAADRLGRHRCRRLRLDGRKDANEALLAGWTAERFAEAVEGAATMKPAEVAKFFEDGADVVEEMKEQEASGTALPWNLPWKIRKGELTVVSGYSGHGKSQGLLHLGVHLADLGWRGMIASLEIPYKRTRSLMLQIAKGSGDLEASDVSALVESNLAEQLLWTKTGRVSWDKLEAAFRYAVKRHGADFLVVDSLMLLGVGKEDYEAQSLMAATLADLALSLDVHIFLVAHARKRPSSAGGEAREPGKDDVAGTADLTNAASNVLSWWRDIKTEAALDVARSEKDVHRQIELAKKPQATATLSKQRITGAHGKVRLFFDHVSGQFWQSRGYRKAYFGLPQPERAKPEKEPVDKTAEMEF